MCRCCNSVRYLLCDFLSAADSECRINRSHSRLSCDLWNKQKGKAMYRGSCLCGAITVELLGRITSVIHCHCSLCRKNSGTAYATNGFIESNDLTVNDPEKVLGYYEHKLGKKRHFCTVCASPVFSSNAENPTRLRIRLGILDSDITECPLSHNFVAFKANWDNPDAQLPRYESFEPSRNTS